MKSQRLRVQLPTPVLLQNNQIVNLTVVGATSFYQVDPANGRVYFEIPDEGREVTITYTYQDANGNQQQAVVTDTVSWGTELAEQPVPIEQAVDEGTIFAFPDPFVWSQADPRPGLIWIMYTSTRNGTRDVFYQTLAPRWIPRPPAEKRSGPHDLGEALRSEVSTFAQYAALAVAFWVKHRLKA